MAQGVVDDFEAIEVKVAEDVLAIAALAPIDRLFQAALEVAPIDEAGERIVGCLVRHLTGKSAQLGHVVQQRDDRRGAVGGRHRGTSPGPSG